MVKRLMKEVVFLVTIGLQVITRPFPDNLPIIYLSLGENYNERVMPSIIHETLKAVVAQYNASQLITQREVVSREIRKLLTERATNFNIALDDVFITILSFGKEFTHGIEAKQVAAQEAERAKFIVEKAEQDKKSFVIRAQDIAIDATTTIGVDLGQGIREVDIKKYIKVEKVPGDQLEDYKVLKGVMFNKDVVASGKMRRKIANPRIILLDCPLEYLSFLFYFLKQIEDLQEKYDAQLHESTELSKQLDATEKSLNHTSMFLASAKESLKQSQYFLEEKDFIIAEESKAEISLANEAFTLRSDLENAIRDNTSLFSKIAISELKKKVYL